MAISPRPDVYFVANTPIYRWGIFIRSSEKTQKSEWTVVEIPPPQGTYLIDNAPIYRWGSLVLSFEKTRKSEWTAVKITRDFRVDISEITVDNTPLYQGGKILVNSK